MARTVAGVICFQCKQPCRVYADDRMTRHKTDIRVPFKNVKEWCRFSGGTWQDARDGISPHMRKVERHIRGLARHENRELTEKESAKLIEWGIM